MGQDAAAVCCSLSMCLALCLDESDSHFYTMQDHSRYARNSRQCKELLIAVA